jgi:hypothetical protein
VSFLFRPEAQGGSSFPDQNIGAGHCGPSKILTARLPGSLQGGNDGQLPGLRVLQGSCGADSTVALSNSDQ